MAAETRFSKPDTAATGSEGEVREKFWRTAKKAARQVPFMDEVVAGYYCALDKNTPLRAKAILLAALGYFVLPADTIPDIVLGLGLHRRHRGADGGDHRGARPHDAGASPGGETGARGRLKPADPVLRAPGKVKLLPFSCS